MNYLTKELTPTAQTEPFDKDQVENSAGGFSYQIDCWNQLRRFLILGSEGGSYYASQQQLTKESLKAVQECIDSDGSRAVSIIREISSSGRASKNDPAIFALAMCASADDAATRKLALNSLPEVCRTSTHLFSFVDAIKRTEMRGFGRGLRKAIAAWYEEKEVNSLAYQVVKYRQRNGWTHRDILRLSHPVPSAEQEGIFNWLTNKPTKTLPAIIEDYQKLSEADSTEARKILSANPNLPWEALPTELLNDKGLWKILISNGIPMTAAMRQLPRLTRLGFFPGADGDKLLSQFNQQAITKSRLHPLTILNSLVTYQSGRGRGSSWTPDPKVIDTLDEAFYLSFGNVDDTGKRVMLSLDVSASMTWNTIAGTQLTPSQASAALALVYMNTNDPVSVNAFSGNSFGDGISPVNLSSRQRLDDAIRTIGDLYHGGTDCALPMIYAKENNLEIDTFMIFTDSETYYGQIHPVEALKKYRRSSGIDAKLIVNGMLSNSFSIADPKDSGMLDVVGFDTATPEIINMFSQGQI